MRERLSTVPKFDGSYDRGQTATLPLNQVYRWLDRGSSAHDDRGAKFRFFIPYQLGYGERGAGASILHSQHWFSM